MFLLIIFSDIFLSLFPILCSNLLLILFSCNRGRVMPAELQQLDSLTEKGVL